jgi:hypothetical protein
MSNLDKIQAFFTAYAKKDVAAVKAVMANDIIWRIPGRHPLAGPKHGVAEVMAFFDQLARADFKAQPLRYCGKRGLHSRPPSRPERGPSGTRPQKREVSSSSSGGDDVAWLAGDKGPDVLHRHCEHAFDGFDAVRRA